MRVYHVVFEGIGWQRAWTLNENRMIRKLGGYYYSVFLFCPFFGGLSQIEMRTKNLFFNIFSVNSFDFIAKVCASHFAADEPQKHHLIVHIKFLPFFIRLLCAQQSQTN